MLEIVVDLERIGDYAVGDSPSTRSNWTTRRCVPRAFEIGRIAAIAQTMLTETMRAYTERDAILAESVIAQDDEVDRLYNRSIEALQDEMQNDAGLVRAGTLMLFVLTSLERVGDRAQNIAWHTKEMLGTA